MFRLATILVVLWCASACSERSEAPSAKSAGTSRDGRTQLVDPVWEATWAEVIATEEALRQVTLELHRIAAAIRNLDDAGMDVAWAKTVTVVGLAPFSRVGAVSPPATSSWPVGAATTHSPGSEARPWSQLLAAARWLDGVRVAGKKARFAGSDRTRVAVPVKFEARLWLQDGTLASLTATVDTQWQRSADADRPWALARWAWQSGKVAATRAPFFAEVLDRIIDDPAVLTSLRRSRHEEWVARLMPLTIPERLKQQPYPEFTLVQGNRHASLSVVDIDGDGWDDLYVMPTLGKNQLLRNKGDGTFEEVAARYGLDLDSHCSAALFADFDNDGDPDAFIGRTLGPSLFLVNDNGRFVSRPDNISEPLPTAISGIAVADVDGDGLLDVYFAAYMAQLAKIARMGFRHGTVQEPQLSRLIRIVGEPTARAYIARLNAVPVTMLRDRPGPPNVLLRNLGGGRFERAPHHGDDLKDWRNSFQGLFADYDDDGDPDIYVTNDFAPNRLLRNDGDWRFTDVTEATGTADVGFGMGASFGDYDEDGRLDLYVTNMYSKAGQRITELAGQRGKSLSEMTRGNSLLRQGSDGRFVRVSGTDRNSVGVEVAGWGWGAQFLDINNDGRLDIYAPAGFLTAPAKIRSVVDT